MAILFQEQAILGIFGRGHYEGHFCEIILNLDQWFRRGCRLKYFLSTALMAILFQDRSHLGNFGRGHYEEHFCEIILNLD